MINGRPVGSSFSDYVLNFIGSAESFEDLTYQDNLGVPTIGYGYALVIKGISDYKGNVFKTERWIVPNYLKVDFQDIHKFSTAELNLLDKIASDLNAKNAAKAETDFNNRGGNLLNFSIDTTAAESLYLNALDRNLKSSHLSNIVANNLSLTNSHELVAMYDLAYNGPATITSTFRADLTAGDRQASWFDILVGMNNSHTYGAENRRIKEANEFGLYSGGNHPSASDGGQESINVFRFLDAHAGSLSTAFTNDAVPAAVGKKFINDSYAPAKAELVSIFGGGHTDLKNVIVAPNDKANVISITDSPAGATLLVTGLGHDRISDTSTKAFNNVINDRASVAVVDGNQIADFSDTLVFGGSSIGGTIALDKNGRGADGHSRTYSYNADSEMMSVTDAAGDKLVITDFRDGDFGLHRDIKFDHVISFDEYPVGTTITTQYKSVGVVVTGNAFISDDSSNNSSPVLSGSPQFQGPIGVRFVDPQTGKATTVHEVKLDAGYFDQIHSTKITFVGADDKLLGSETNSTTGIQSLVFESDAGIAGFTIIEVGREDNGFAIDNLAYVFHGAS